MVSKYRSLLFPFVPIYRFGVWLRNLCFDLGIFKQHSFDIPIIDIGNIQTGGTGKTPIVENLIEKYSSSYNIVTLSRGYKRKTKGFRVASEIDNASTIGDEPLQYFTKFKNIKVVVCENRVRGVQKILKQFPETNLILLDDAYQHRHIKAGFHILLTDYFKLFSKDYLLPAGNLREPVKSKKRANIIIVANTPSVYSPIIHRDLKEQLKPTVGQLLVPAYIEYNGIKPVFDFDNSNNDFLKDINTILMVAGIGDPDAFAYHLKSYCYEVETMVFPDHYSYEAKDYKNILDRFNNLPTLRKAIVTTEKDAMRFNNELAKEFLSKLPFYYIPIKSKIHEKYSSKFYSTVDNYLNSPRDF